MKSDLKIEIKDEKEGVYLLFHSLDLDNVNRLMFHHVGNDYLLNIQAIKIDKLKND